MTMLKDASSFTSDVTFSKQQQHLGKQPSTSFSGRSVTVPPSPEVERINKINKYKSIAKSIFLKYWFLLGLIVAILLAWGFPDVGRKNGYVHAEWSIKWGNYIIIIIILFESDLVFFFQAPL